MNAAAIFSVHIFDVRTSRPKLPAATTVKTARTNTIGNTKSEYHAIPEQRLDRGAGEVSSRTTAETGDKQTDLRGCLTAKPERMTQVPSLTTNLLFLPQIFGAQGTAPSSLDSFTQLVINSSNFYARFLSFSREYDASGKRFREAEGEASPQSPPAGALLLQKKKKVKRKKKIFFLNN